MYAVSDVELIGLLHVKLSITNVVSSVTNTVNNVVQTTQNVISTTQLVGQILWDNAFGPSVDLFLNRISFQILVE